MKTADFTFDLPEELIAQYPPEQRGASRLLCVNKNSGQVQDQRFSDLPSLLKDGDLLVFNNTRVIPARLFGNKPSGGKVEILVERLLDEHNALAQIKASKSPKAESQIVLSSGEELTVMGRDGDMFLLRSDKVLLNVLYESGHMPLPPYITRNDEQTDESRYQTIFAAKDGAVAAPTAGLHFTDDLLQEVKAKQVQTAELTLHVGAGTFQPVRVDDVSEHKMHSELFEVNQQTCDKIQETKANGGRVIAVGTTSVRTLETIGIRGELKACSGETDIFIYPGFEFKLVDAMITNFHLPESTLLMLVSAFASKENILNAYKYAVEQQYRFFSYGDAMWIA